MMMIRSDPRTLRLRTYWLALFLCLPAAWAAELLPYETHQLLPPGDSVTAELALSTPFVFLQQNYSAVTVS